jgi:metallopeptidase MepB
MSIPYRLPRVLSANEIVPTMKDMVARLEAIQNEIVQNVTPSTATFDNVLRPYAQLQNELQDRIGVIFMLQYAAPDMETQDAVSEAIAIWSQAEGPRNSREDMFRLLQAVESAKEDLDPESQLLLRERLLDFKQRGMGVLSTSQVKEYVDGWVEINDMCRTFQRNIAEEHSGLWFTEEELDGVPSHDFDRWEEEAGTWFVPFANNGTTTILTYAHNPETRRRMFLANGTTLSQNGPLFEKIITKRCLLASSLGYRNHASYMAKRRLVQSVEWIGSFLDQFKTGLAPLVQLELDIMQRRRLRDLESMGRPRNGDAEPFPVWDKAYYAEVLKQEFGIKQAKIAEFFPLESTAAAMLDVFSSLLGVRFDRIPDDQLDGHAIWHESVKVYSVWEADSPEFVGYLYFDLVWRKNKYRGNQNVTHEFVSTVARATLTSIFT